MKLFAVIDGLAVPGKTDDERREMAYRNKMQYSVEPYTAQTPKRAIIGLFPSEHVAKWMCDERNGTHRTIEQAAKEAIQVQDACNLSGVSISFRQAVQAITREPAGVGKLRTHPIMILFLDKMFDLIGRPDTSDYGKAFHQCEALARGESIEREAVA